MWDAVQKAGEKRGKSQPAASFDGLFHEADLLNDILQVKLHQICVDCGGEFHGAAVKTEARALEKVFRAYACNWRRLCDLTRSTLVFDSLEDVKKALQMIGDDKEVIVVKTSDDKMRFREEGTTCSGGYRDVQLSVCIATPKAIERQVHNHLCEVQLQLRDFYDLKSGAGHKTYKMMRNLTGK